MGGGNVKGMSLVWNELQLAERKANLKKAQAYIDSEVLRYSDPLTPKKTGNLINSAKTGTVIGDGEINYTAPYAHTQYYNTAQTRDYDPQRGGKWFERMKAAHKNDILKGAKELL